MLSLFKCKISKNLSMGYVLPHEIFASMQQCRSQRLQRGFVALIGHTSIWPDGLLHIIYNTRARALHYKMPPGVGTMQLGVESDAAERQNNAAQGRINAARGQKNVRTTSDRRFREHESRFLMCYHMLIKLSLQAFPSKQRCGNRKFFAEILYGISDYNTPS